MREPFGRAVAPERAALLVRGDARPFALVGDWAGGGALVGSEPVRVARPDEDPFALLDDQPVAGTEGVGGGWFGWLGYGLGRRVEPATSAPPPRPEPLPDFALAYYDHLLHLDADGEWWFEALWTPERDTVLRARLAELRGRASGLTPRAFDTGELRPTPAWAGHAAAVAAGRERIHHGDLFQANLSVRLETTLSGDPVDLFCAGVEVLRPARAAYLAGEWGAVASLSPEIFLRRHGREVVTEPIKGTRPSDRRDELLASAKDRAENVMIVDLMRNDLGRVCDPGSVHVPALFGVREHTGVWHAVSTVAGTLRDGVGDADLLRATFPPGSVTGAPKPAALDVIAELESTGREVYTGAIGFASPLAGLELNVAIRTFECALDGSLWLGVGGGVVADSDPGAEAAEAAIKAAPLLAAIRAAPLVDLGAGGPPRGRPVRLGPRPLPRPDPARGVLTTLAARDGRPVSLTAHLARLGASVMELYGHPLPADLPARVASAAAVDPALARLRVLAFPDGSVEVQRLPAPPLDGPPLRLRTFVIPGGLGAHKWLDRRWIDALTAACEPDEIPFWTDLDGLALEAGPANVFIREDGRLSTPPADGRILPGVTRAELLVFSGAREERIPLARLLAADEIILTSALSGTRRVLPPRADRLPVGVRVL